MDSGIPIPLDGLISPAVPDSPERGLKRSMEYDERDGRPTKGPRLSTTDGHFGGYPNGQWAGHGGMNGMNMSRIGMNTGVNGNMGQMNGRRPQGYQPPDPKRGLCRDYHSTLRYSSLYFISGTYA
jgi:RNA-binding protein 26